MSGGQVSPELRRATLSGARWTAISRLGAETIALVASVTLARLVPPAEFGHAAVALIVVALSAIIGTAGISAPLVQRQEITGPLVGAVTAISLAFGAGLTAVTVVVAELFLSRMFDDRTVELVVLASPAWLLAAIGSPSQALLQRRLLFRRLAAIEVTSVLASAGLAVALALAGADGEAVVAAGLGLVGFIGLLSFAAVPVRTFGTDRSTVKDTLAFATPVALSSLVYVGFRNIDYAILGARATATQLGYYWRAFQLGVEYQSKISRVMLRVSFPVYSRAASVSELRSLRTRIVRGHATILVPLLAFFIAVAPVVVPWLFGSAWEPSVRPAQILAVAGMADAIVTGVGPLMIALGRPAALLRWNILVLGGYAAMVFVLAPYGIQTVAIGVAVFGVATVFAAQLLLLGPHAGLSFRQLWEDTRAGVAVGAGVLVAVTALRELLEPLELDAVVVLLLLGAAAALLYAALLRTSFRSEWGDLWAIVWRAGDRPPAGEGSIVIDERQPPT